MGFGPGPVELLIIGLLCATFVGIPAIVIVAILAGRTRAGGQPSHYGRVRCPDCAEWVVAEALKCRFCGADLGDDRPPDSEELADESPG